MKEWKARMTKCRVKRRRRLMLEFFITLRRKVHLRKKMVAFRLGQQLQTMSAVYQELWDRW